MTKYGHDSPLHFARREQFESEPSAERVAMAAAGQPGEPLGLTLREVRRAGTVGTSHGIVGAPRPLTVMM